MKIDLQTLEESVRNEILSLATDSLGFDGRFSYDKNQYVATKLPDNSIEIKKFQVVKYKLENFSPEKQQEFKNKVNLAKQSSNPDDRKFQIDDILIEVKEVASGSFIIQTSIKNSNVI